MQIKNYTSYKDYNIFIFYNIVPETYMNIYQL